jgi:hypothetical protein
VTLILGVSSIIIISRSTFQAQAVRRLGFFLDEKYYKYG